MNRLKEYREKVDISQRALARKVGLHWTTIWNIEHDRGEPTVRNAFKIARAVNATPQQIWMI